MMTVSLIWAMDDNGLIGRDNQLPWSLPADMRWFRQHTLGKTIVMGRKTYDSIGRPLPERRNLVLTQQQGLSIEGCEVVHSLEQALQVLPDRQIDELMVMGGAQVYHLALPLAQRLYVTRIHAAFEGDAWFPQFNWDQWREIERTDHQPDEKNAYPYSFSIYERQV